VTGTPVTFRTIEISDPRFEEGGLRHITVKSPALHRRADITVFVPPGDEPLPLVILLHGVFASHWGWTGSGGAHRTLQRMLDSKRIRPVALAMPSDGLFGDGSLYTRVDGEDAEAWIIDDVPAAVAQAEPRVAPDARIALCGLSMGGHGALRLAALHPDRVFAACAMSSLVELEHFAMMVEEPLDRYEIPAEQRSLAGLLASVPRASLPALRIDCGRDDPLVFSNRELHQALDAAAVPHEYEEFEGTHSWDYWAAHLEDALLFIDSARP
jgi:putative tributyrin esterase